MTAACLDPRHEDDMQERERLLRVLCGFVVQHWESTRDHEHPHQQRPAVGQPDGDWPRSAPPTRAASSRLALTDLDRQARDLFVALVPSRPAAPSRVDKMGNIFARRPGKDDSLPPVMTGSHIDTQPTGGKFDGNYGVLAGLEVLRTLNDFNYETNAADRGGRLDQRGGLALRPGDDRLRRLRRRVRPGLRPIAARTSTARPSARSWQRIGYAGDRDCRQARGRRPSSRPHIEQGPILEAEDKTIGVVEGVQGIRWYEVHGDRPGEPMPARRRCSCARTRWSARADGAGGEPHRHGQPPLRLRHRRHAAGAAELAAT